MNKLTQAEENYLKTICHLSDLGVKDVSTNAIAESLNTKAASVSDMIKKLSDKGLVSYKKYKGVNVSSEGKSIALQVIRKHRLWEVFLVNKLNFKWDEVHEIAEQLEHIDSSLLTNRLDAYLGFPKSDPHGDPIPNVEGKIVITQKMPLSELAVGSSAVITGVENSDAEFLAHLDKNDISIGQKIKVNDKNSYDNSLDITIDTRPKLFISNLTAQNILVSQ